MGKSTKDSILINNRDILETLSSVGVFISNYVTGEYLASNQWQSISKPFNSKNTKEASFFNYIHEEDRERIKKAREDIFNGDKTELHEIYRLKYAEGLYRWIHSLGRTATKTIDGKTEYFVGFDFDISDLKETEHRLRISIEEEKKRSMELEILRQIVKVISSSLDLKDTVHKILKEIGKLIPYETASVEILQNGFLTPIGAEGFVDNEVVTNMKFEYPAEESLSTFALQNNKPLLCNNITKEFPTFRQPGGQKLVESWIGIPLISNGEIIGLLALDGYEKNHFNEHHLELSEIIGDHITIALENSVLHEKAYKMAMEDALTGLGSRHRMQIEGRLLFNTAIRSHSNISFAMIDIDFFKKVNDEYSHGVGDIVLKNISKTCLEEIRDTDLLARYGGEEFILIMPNTLMDEAGIVLERIRNKVELITHSNIPYQITISIGICSGIPKRDDTMGSFISIADEQLYLSKDNGRNRISSTIIN